ncbi:hypothetical protein [Prevotella sp.]
MGNDTIHALLHYFPLVSDRWFGEAVRLSFPSTKAFPYYKESLSLP